MWGREVQSSYPRHARVRSLAEFLASSVRRHDHLYGHSRTLAHGGLLFMDEITEFRPDALEALRQPPEQELLAVALARASVRSYAAIRCRMRKASPY